MISSLPTLLFQFALAGALLTALTVWKKKHNQIFMTFLQHFCGVWFIFSGLVKAVDPIGTAYKMEDYFAAFSQTFEGLNNVFAKLAPVFPWLSGYSIGFSIFMVLLEIVLGVMLIVGYRRKLTAWLFFITMIFFTALTGFTYLTGYVPSDANFFDFAKWGPYKKELMRVTDCGCFGDFIKLDPKVSFFKDLGLMIPAFLFLFRSKWMHQLFNSRLRGYATWGATAFTILLCVQNTYLDLPMVDFRPFKIGNNIREKKALEEEARSNVQILGYVLKNDSLKQVVTYMEPDPAKPYSYVKQYPKAAGWKVFEQIKNEPFIEKDGQKILVPSTKVSEFAIEDADNNEITEDLLAEKGYSLIIVAYKFYGDMKTETITVQDTTWASDTIRINKDSINIVQRVAALTPRQIEREVFEPQADYAALFEKQVNPLADAAAKAGWKVYALATHGDFAKSKDLLKKTNGKYPFYKGDDKLLKTIIRANPGIVVMKDGQVLDMYHHRHLPGFDKLSATWK
jgi:uncharacterized membrane protein YphA (DoxX/SURF4 family)